MAIFQTNNTVFVNKDEQFVIKCTDFERVAAVREEIPGLKRLSAGQYLAPGTKESYNSLRRLGFAITKDAWKSAIDAPLKAAARIVLSKQSTAHLDLLGFGKEPFPFQNAGIIYALNAKRCIIGDDMGLGKTIQGLGTVFAANAFPLLVCTPASNKYQWSDVEVPLCLPGKIVVLADKNTGPLQLAMADVIVTNYDQLVGFRNLPGGGRSSWADSTKKHVVLSPLAEKLRQLNLKSIILDEAHMIKNPSSARTHAVMELRHTAEYRLCLTGTPMLNKPAEFYSLLKFLDRMHEFGGYMHFMKHWCGMRKTKFGMQANEAHHTLELNEKLRSICYVRRKKVDVLKELPPKLRTSYAVDITNRAEYEKAEKELIQFVQDRVEKDKKFLESIEHLEPNERASAIHQRKIDKAAAAERAEMMVMISALRMVVAEGKLKAAFEWIENFLESDEKLVAFAMHKNIINELLTKYPEAAKIISEDEVIERQANVRNFQERSEIRLLVGAMGTSAVSSPAGVGHTLTASSNVLFLELGWNPGHLDQCEDRCLAAGTPILTPSGWIPIEDIRIGDKVIAASGLPRTVKDAWNQSCRKQMVDILIEGWGEISATHDHKFLTVNGWKEAGSLKPGDRLAMPGLEDGAAIDSVPFDEDCRLTTGNGRAVPAPEAVPISDDLLFAIGYYIGDGFASTAAGKGRFVSFAGNNGKKTPHLERIQRLFESFGVTATISDDKQSNGRELRCYSAEWTFWFAKHFGRVCQEKQVAHWCQVLSTEQSIMILRGLIASDGYVRNNRYEYSTVVRRLAAQVALIMIRCGRRPTVVQNKAGEFIVAYSMGTTPDALVRQVTQRYPRKPKGIHERVYDLTVEEEESFVTGLVVAHNCHRIGQQDNVTIHYLLGKNTIDQKLASIIESKRAIAAQVVDGDEGEIDNGILDELTDWILNKGEAA